MRSNMSAKPEELNGFNFFNFAKVGMIGSNKQTSQLNSGCQSNGIAQRNGVLRFKAGNLGKNYPVNGVDELNRYRSYR